MYFIWRVSLLEAKNSWIQGRRTVRSGVTQCVISVSEGIPIVYNDSVHLGIIEHWVTMTGISIMLR